jgi:hypothetical protein
MVINTASYVRLGNRTYEGVMALVIIGNRKVLLSAPYKFRRQEVLSVGVIGGKVSVVPPPTCWPAKSVPKTPPSPVKELPKLTGSLRRLPTPRFRRRGPETTHEGYSVHRLAEIPWSRKGLLGHTSVEYY